MPTLEEERDQILATPLNGLTIADFEAKGNRLRELAFQIGTPGSLRESPSTQVDIARPKDAIPPTKGSKPPSLGVGASWSGIRLPTGRS